VERAQKATKEKKFNQIFAKTPSRIYQQTREFDNITSIRDSRSWTSLSVFHEQRRASRGRLAWCARLTSRSFTRLRVIRVRTYAWRTRLVVVGQTIVVMLEARWRHDQSPLGPSRTHSSVVPFTRVLRRRTRLTKISSQSVVSLASIDLEINGRGNTCAKSGIVSRKIGSANVIIKPVLLSLELEHFLDHPTVDIRESCEGLSLERSL